MGTGLQIGAGVFGVDAILDARDIVADVAQWEWTKDHAIQTSIDVIALIPLVGALKYSDEALVLVKSGDKAYAVTKNVGEIIDVTKHLDDVLPALKNTDNFASGKLKHIFSGEINKAGKAVGFHYEGLSGVDGKVIEITKAPNKYGVYQAKVEVAGKVKKDFSTFFPKDWTPQQVVDAINEAFANKVSKGIYEEGISKSGIKIRMYIENDKITSAFPIY